MLGKSLRHLARNTMLAQQQRSFGVGSTTFTQHHLLGDSVFMRQVIPSKLTVPLNNEERLEYTIEGDQTVAEFEQMVKDGSQGALSNFELSRPDLESSETFDKEQIKMADFKARKFYMNVNQSKLQVYPDLASIYNKRIGNITSLFCNSSQVDVPRQIVLTDFNKILNKEIDGLTQKNLNAEDVDALFEKTINSYSKYRIDMAEAHKDSIRIAVEEIRADLEKEQQQRKDVIRSAHKRAGMLMGAAFVGCTAQLFGFGSAIYIIYDWNTVEPWTWTFQAFYLMVGSWYFLLTKSDWDYTAGYHALQQRYLKNFAEKRGVNLDKAEHLEKYLTSLEEKIQMVTPIIYDEIHKNSKSQE